MGCPNVPANLQRLVRQLLPLLFLLALLVVVQAVCAAATAMDPTGERPQWVRFGGVLPRDSGHLSGILLHFLFHSSWTHLFHNGTPLAVASTAILLTDGQAVYAAAVFLSVLSTGLTTWLAGEVGHMAIGASGLVFGLLGFLITSGFARKTARTLCVAIITAVTFSGSLWGMLPFRGSNRMTWLGHAAGFVGGAAAAYLTALHRAGKSHPAGVISSSSSSSNGQGKDWMDTYGPVKDGPRFTV